MFIPTDHLKKAKYRPIYRFTATQKSTSQFSHHVHGLVIILVQPLNNMRDEGFLIADVDTDNQSVD